MNFFGHAVVASWSSTEPGYVLGAMMPDFTRLCGASPEEVSGAVAAGLELHHRTDRVFHETAGFQALWTRAAGALRGAGLERGPARAAAHVAIELLLDGVLAADGRACRAYREALASACRGALRDQARFGAAGEPRWSALLARVSRAPVPAAYGDPAAVAERVVMLLSFRPRLQMPDSGRPALDALLPSLQRDVRHRAPEIVAELGPKLVG